ncbi:hypothetical protein TRFO_07770 [Tritrichomonas foetus]|uniref:Uncharacterized protein n=1 Tax=Tritrichomonas foetus TaxID=1144522 RepID=A0A1J4JTE1_9EUKA|nr:hypothetical protein TRFO_07770 [Tritrichomonas foetus]|eukprot:OHT00790.1 hypothetical protein TRFO_07770 [Tritrichomonas foetus]
MLFALLICAKTLSYSHENERKNSLDRKSEVENFPTVKSANHQTKPIISNEDKINLLGTPPNTRMINDSLICEEGYISDKGIAQKGCWKCEQKCLKREAFCAYPGKCVCHRGLLGDGINDCYHPIPTIVNVTNPPTSNFIWVNFTDVDPQYQIREAFCKFNYTIVLASLDNGLLKCGLSIDAKDNRFVQISFDFFNWSQPYIIDDVWGAEQSKKAQEMQEAIEWGMPKAKKLTVVMLIVFLFLLPKIWRQVKNKQIADQHMRERVNTDAVFISA